MLTFSPFVFSNNNENTIILNLSSYIEGYPRLTELDPLTYYNVGISAEYDFDIWYAQYINGYSQYKQFLDIMISVYNGIDVIILVNNKNNYSTMLVESLFKYITERYGFVCNVINEPDDIPYIQESTFSSQGILNMDKDIENYRYQYGIKNLGSCDNYD